MDEISNKTLAMLLMLAIVISLGGTFFAMRGMNQVTNIVSGHASSATGTAKVNISETASIVLSYNSVVANEVDFGTGYRNASEISDDSTCNLTAGAPKPDCWANLSEYAPSPFTVENDGNVFVNVSINSTAAASWFDNCAGSTNVISATPNATWFGVNLSTGCTAAGTLNISNVTFTGNPQLVCSNLSASDAIDEFNVSIMVGIPVGPGGQCDNDVIFQATPS